MAPFFVFSFRVECLGGTPGTPYSLLPRHDAVILTFLRLQVAEVVIFEVDAHPVELSGELAALTFGMVVRDGHRQVAAHVHRLVQREEERARVADLALSH